jgi:hypothetical protein
VKTNHKTTPAPEKSQKIRYAMHCVRLSRRSDPTSQVLPRLPRVARL